MSEEIEGVGTALTGGRSARVSEDQAGEGGGPDIFCLNCGTPLAGDYCHACGQAAHVHRSLTGFWHDLAHGVLHFEGKIWRTLPLLAWRPGELTRRYIAGERSRFVSPIALFLFSVFLMFAVFNAVGGPFGNTGGLRTTAPVEASQGSDAVRIDGLETAPAWLNTLIRQARGNPSLLAYKLQSNAYKFSWALIPISVPFVWLLFAFRRQYRAYDHLVFVTYSIAFMSLLLVLLSLVQAAGLPDAFGTLALLLVPPLHIYRQLKGAYQLRRFAALWRTIALLLFAAIAILLFFMLVFAIGAH